MEKYSLDYIIGFINRQEPLPKQFNKALSSLVDQTFNRGLYAITLEELLNQLSIEIDEKKDITEEYYFNPATLYKLVSILYRHKLSMIPMSVPNNLPLTNIVHLLKSPDLTQDPDIATVQELKAKNHREYTSAQCGIIQKAVTKLNNFNILLRVFEGFGAMQARALDVNQRSALSNLLNNSVTLPRDGQRYIRCLFGYVCDYGSYVYDYTNANYVHAPLANNLVPEMLDILARVLSASKVNLTANPSYPYAKALQEAYNKYCPVNQAHEDPFITQVTIKRVPLAMRPLSALTSKQKIKRLALDLNNFKRTITESNFDDFLSVREGISSRFIDVVATALNAADQEIKSELIELNQDLLQDTATRLMLPNLEKCELFVENINLQECIISDPRITLADVPALSQTLSEQYRLPNGKSVVKDGKGGNVTLNDFAQNGQGAVHGSKLVEGSAASKLNSHTVSITGENGVSGRSTGLGNKGANGGNGLNGSNGQELSEAQVKANEMFKNILTDFAYTSREQMFATGLGFNAISYTWDELTHYNFSQLIYAPDQDFLHPDVDQDYGSNLEQFLKQPLKQLSNRLNQINFFEFILKPILSGKFTNNQLQFFEQQVGNNYVLNNANPIPFLFCHGLFIFDKYLMQPRNHFNNEMFYLSLFSREPYAINLYLTRIINKYGPYLCNIPEDFYILIVMLIILFPQTQQEKGSFNLVRLLNTYGHGSIQLGTIVLLHSFAHQLYMLVQEDEEYEDLQLVLVKNPQERDAMLLNKQAIQQRSTLVCKYPQNSQKSQTKEQKNTLFTNASDLDYDDDALLEINLVEMDARVKEHDEDKFTSPQDKLLFKHYQDELEQEESKKRGYRSRKAYALSQDESILPDECNQHLNPCFASSNSRSVIEANYHRNLVDDPARQLLENYIFPIAKRIVSSDHNSIYMFNKVLDITEIFDSLFAMFNQHLVDSIRYADLQRNRFIIDSFVLSQDEEQLRNLQHIALRAETTQEIGFAHGILTKHLNELSTILFSTLHLQLIPVYVPNPDTVKYQQLRPAVHYIRLIKVPHIFQNISMREAYEDILVSLQLGAVAIELGRAITSHINRPLDMIEALVKEVIITHNSQGFKEVISFTYNYLQNSYKLIDLEGRLNIDLLLESEMSLDQVLYHPKFQNRMYKMLAVVMNHLVEANKLTTTIKTRYIKLLLKLKAKDASLLNILHAMNPEPELINQLAGQIPRQILNKPIEIDMSKVRSKIKESSEVQDVISKVREEQALLEAQEQAQEQIALKDRIAMYQQQQNSLGTAPTQEQLAATTKGSKDTEHVASNHVDSDVAEQNSKTEQCSEVTQGSSGTNTNAQSTATNTNDAELQQQLEDLAPVAMKLSAKARNVLEAVILQNIEAMDLREFNGLCVAHRYMSANAAIEEINDVCMEEFDDLLFEADHDQGVIYITTDILNELGTQCAKFKELTQA